MEEKGGEQENCGVHALLNKYGPDYEKLKEKVGHLRHYFLE